MSLNIPPKETVRATVRALWQSERPDADDSTYSDLWLYSRIVSVVVFRLHQTIQRGINAVFPTTSFGSYLGAWLSWIGASDGLGGFGYIVPRISSGTDAGRATADGGDIAANALNGKQMTDAAGKLYQFNENHVLVPDGTTIDLDIISITKGSATNLESGTVLTLTSPPANARSAVTLVADLDGGADAETETDGRARLLSLLRSPPASGNVASWVKTIEDTSPGALKAYVWPKREEPPGYGRVDYCALQTLETGEDRYIAAADDLYSDIEDEVEDKLPVLMFKNSRQLTLVSDTGGVDITYTLADNATESQKCDWDSENNKNLITANDDGGPNITVDVNVCSPTVTNGLEVGHVVVIDGIPGTVTSVNVGADPKVFAVASGWAWPSVANVLNGLAVTSGGGLIGNIDYTDSGGTAVARSGVIGTLQTYFDGLGPARGTYAATAIQDWDDTARIQGIQSDIIQLGGGSIISVTVDDLLGDVIDYAPSTGSSSIAEIINISEFIAHQVFV